MKKLLDLVECCLNWRVLVGAASIGVTIFVFEPGLIGVDLPILLASICPISMLLMIRRMAATPGGQRPQAPLAAEPGFEARAQQLATLKERLGHSLSRQASIRDQLNSLEGMSTSTDDDQVTTAGVRPVLRDSNSSGWSVG